MESKKKSRHGFSGRYPFDPPNQAFGQPVESPHNPDTDHIPQTHFLDIIEFLPDPTFVIDRQGRVLAWNRAIEDMTGVPKSAILGKGDYAYSVPFYGEARPIVIDYAMGAGSGIESRYVYIQKEGDTCFAETYCPLLYGGKGAFLWGKASPLYDPEGNIVGAVESIRDLTVRKKAEEALSRSEEKYRELVENANSIILRMDTAGNITFFNEFAERFFGFTQEEINGRNVVGTIVPAIDSSGRNLSKMIKNLLRDPERFVSNENENMLRNGERVWVAWTNKAMCDLGGEVREILCIGNDVTQRKRIEDALAESEEKYRLIFRHTPLGIFHFDSDGTVTACNDKILEIWGSTKELFIGFNLLSSVKNKKMKAAVKACLTGCYACYEGSYLSGTGGKITNLKADFGPMLSPDDSVMGGIGIIQDISERKKAEAALLESENRLRLLSAQLLEAQESERKRVARELHDSIGSLLSGIKISLENATELAKKPAFSSDSLRSIVALVQHAIDESRRITADLRPSMLDDLGVITTLRWFTRQFQSAYPGILVRTVMEIEEENIPEHLKIVIFRVVQEAFHNIAKHSGADSVVFKLGKSDDRIHMRIEDNGRGFDPAKMYDKENRGLGLISMSERTEFSGGKMTINSMEGGGTLVRANWPLKIDEH